MTMMPNAEINAMRAELHGLYAEMQTASFSEESFRIAVIRAKLGDRYDEAMGRSGSLAMWTDAEFYAPAHIRKDLGITACMNIADAAQRLKNANTP